MNLTEALQQLADLHASGALTADEFAAGKARLLSASNDTAQPDAASKRQAELLRAEAAIARLDREWQIEREKFMTSGNFGYRMMPRKGWAIFSGIGAVLFGSFWMLTVFRSGAPWFFVLFGAGVIIAAVVQAADMYRKACAYEVADKKYQARRAELLASADLTA